VLVCCCVCCCSGLTKVPIDGQPLSIVQDLEDMCRQYIKVQWAQAAAGAAGSSKGRSSGNGTAAAAVAMAERQRQQYRGDMCRQHNRYTPGAAAHPEAAAEAGAVPAAAAAEPR
jgi:hypothetical protein